MLRIKSTHLPIFSGIINRNTAAGQMNQRAASPFGDGFMILYFTPYVHTLPALRVGAVLSALPPILPSSYINCQKIHMACLSSYPALCLGIVSCLTQHLTMFHWILKLLQFSDKCRYPITCSVGGVSKLSHLMISTTSYICPPAAFIVNSHFDEKLAS
jgi:hypothetical protein